MANVRGELHLEKLNIIYKVPHFGEVPSEPGTVIVSQSFTFGSSLDSQLKFYISLYPGGNRKESEGYLSIFLNAESLKEPTMEFHIEIAIIGVNGAKFRKLHFEHKLPFKTGTGFPKYISREYLLQDAKKLLPDDTLTIWCQIGEQSPMALKEKLGKFSKFQVAHDLKFLLEDEATSDMTLVVNTRKFSVHKAILSARSKTFASMFKSQIIGNSKNLIIPDIEAEAFSEFLRFVYTGHSEKLEQFAESLLFVADKYKIAELKLACQYEMIGKLSVEKAIGFLIQSHRFTALQLKEKCVEFINANAADVIKRSEWSDLIKNYPELVTELYSKK